MPATRALPPDLASAARWLDAWRGRRTTRRLPEEVWARAAALSRRHGASATRRALRLDFYKFERLCRRPGAAPASVTKRPTFVEIAPGAPVAPPGSAAEFVVDFDDGRGARMRVRLPQTATAAVDGLARLFLGRPA